MLAKYRDLVLAFVVLVVGLLLLSTAVYWEISVWRECRLTNSFLYCWRVIS